LYACPRHCYASSGWAGCVAYGTGSAIILAETITPGVEGWREVAGSSSMRDDAIIYSVFVRGAISDLYFSFVDRAISTPSHWSEPSKRPQHLEIQLARFRPRFPKRCSDAQSFRRSTRLARKPVQQQSLNSSRWVAMQFSSCFRRKTSLWCRPCLCGRRPWSRS